MSTIHSWEIIIWFVYSHLRVITEPFAYQFQNTFFCKSLYNIFLQKFHSKTLHIIKLNILSFLSASKKYNSYNIYFV
jgi:hypothetical protein